MTEHHRRRQYERRKKPTTPRDFVIWGYDRTNKMWRALSVDETGRLIIDPSDLDTRYHKKSEILDMEGFNITDCGSIVPKAPTGTYLLGWKGGGLWWKESAIMTMYLGSVLKCEAANNYLYTHEAIGSSFGAYSHDGAALVRKWLIKGGNIMMENLPVADPVDGTSTLWKNGQVVTVGT